MRGAVLLLLRGWSAGVFLPAFVSTFAAALFHCFFLRVELCLLFRSENGADLGHLLGASRLSYLTGLLHVAAERSGVTLLARGTGRIDERLGLGAGRLVLRLILLADRLDLGLLGLGQVEIATEFTATAELTTVATTTIMTAVGLGRSGLRLRRRNSRHANEHHGAKRQGTS